MEQELFDDLVQSLNEAVDYSRGDKSKGRSVVLSIPDEEVEEVFYQNFSKLSDPNKQKAMQYVNDLLNASNA